MFPSVVECGNTRYFGVNASADDHQPPDPFAGGGHGGHEAVHRALSRLGGVASHKMDRMAMGHFYGVRGVTVRNSRTHRHIGLTASAAVAGVKRSRPTAFMKADVLQLCSQNLHVRTQRVHGTIDAEATRGQGTVNIEVWVP